MRLVTVAILVLFSFSALAADIEPVFQALQQSAVNYEPDGSVCEQVALLKLRESYPTEDFSIANGVEYSTGGDTLGELDLVVVEKKTNKVVLVGEVKCWRNLQQAMDKLKAQRDRFTWNLTKHTQQMQFTDYEGFNFKVEQFEGISNFRSISQLGGIRRGFDVELDFTLSELKELRSKLLKCQAWGHCARPE